MRIWVDADACPKPAKEILYRAAKRVKVITTFVANLPLKIPAYPYLKTKLVPGGFDVADEQIIQQVKQGDLVITADIPLAAKVVEKGAFALNPRGMFYNKENINEALSIRNLMDELRGGGLETGGPPPFNNRDREVFANSLDKFLRGLM